MISVIIPTYNREKLIRRAVMSVLDQTWSDLEVIVVDDCSTDLTRQVVESLQDDRLSYHCMETNGGACAARNRGIELARGEYIAFQDSDDEWMPEKLEKQMQQLIQSGADIVFCSFERYDTDGRMVQVFPPENTAPGKITYQQLLTGNLISTQTMLGRKECFETICFDVAFPRLQDWELMLRMVQHFEVHYFSTPFVRLYEQPDSISKQPQKMVCALDMLYTKNQDAIEKDRSLHVAFRCMQYSAARDCGERVWMQYLKELSLRNEVRTNIHLVKLSLTNLLRHP